MSTRQRTTWQGGGDKAASKQPVLPVEKARAASAHPATPDEGAAHPAHQPDPGEHDYENGDTSSWAEDPTKGPYPNSAHPATPDEGPGHPAFKQTSTGTSVGEDQVTNDDLGVSKAAAHELRASVERKAAKCIRIASALLGPKATVAAVEDQALDFMDMSDDAISMTLNRLAADEDDKAGEDEVAEDDKESKKKAKSAEDEVEAEDDKESKKKANSEKSATDQILAAIEGLGARLTALEKGKTSASDDEMLANLLAEEAPATACGEPMAAEEPVAQDDVESMLMSMIDEPTATKADEFDMVGPVDDGDLGIDMGIVEDPMGLLGDIDMDEDEEALLATLFADSRMASKKGEDEEAEEVEVEGDDEEEEKEAKKKAAAAAARKPRPKAASTGATRLGRVQKEAASDIKELEKLWPSAPDVSNVFG